MARLHGFGEPSQASRNSTTSLKTALAPAESDAKGQSTKSKGLELNVLGKTKTDEVVPKAGTVSGPVMTHGEAPVCHPRSHPGSRVCHYPCWYASASPPVDGGGECLYGTAPVDFRPCPSRSAVWPHVDTSRRQSCDSACSPSLLHQGIIPPTIPTDIRVPGLLL